MKLARGIVRWFNPHFGYGFLRAENGEDVFVHYKSIKSNEPKKTIAEGQIVYYQAEDTDKGVKAVEVIP